MTKEEYNHLPLSSISVKNHNLFVEALTASNNIIFVLRMNEKNPIMKKSIEDQMTINSILLSMDKKT